MFFGEAAIIFYQPERAQRANGKNALRFPRLFVCLSVAVRPHLSRAQYNTPYVTMQLQLAAFGGLQAKLQQMKVVLCCLDGENVVVI